LREDAALLVAVEEIRATVAQLEGALATEALPAVPELKRMASNELGRAAIIPGKDLYKLDGGPLPTKYLKFPRLARSFVFHRPIL